MSATIQTEGLGYSVFGTAQVSYVVEGVHGQSFDYAVAMTGLKRAATIEQAIPAYTAAIRARQTRSIDLGNALADIARALQTVDRDSKDMTNEKVTISMDAYNLLAKYGCIDASQTCTIKFFDLQRIQTDVQYKLDVTNNDIQQDMTTLQGYVSKRDSAYSMADKLMKKVAKTFTSGTRYIQ